MDKATNIIVLLSLYKGIYTEDLCSSPFAPFKRQDVVDSCNYLEENGYICRVEDDYDFTPKGASFVLKLISNTEFK